jgi:catechol 2,3-dioxygenase-like lactoylglutathione lyase family enzyme
VTEFKADHFHLRSLDPEKSARFYEEMFGAERLGTVDNAGKLRVVVDLGGVRLFIEEVPPGTHAAPEPPYLGLEHIGLAVSGIDAVAVELKRKGAEFIVEPRSPRPGTRIAFIRGPENVRIELVDRTAA